MRNIISSIHEVARTRGIRALIVAIYNNCLAYSLGKVLGRRFIWRRVNDYRMMLDLEDKGISRTLLLFGTRELDHKYLLEQIIKPGMNIFDVGSNIGYYPLLELKLLNNTGRLLAIEPSTSNISLLKKNLRHNDAEQNVQIIEGAVSDESGTSTFHLSTQSNLGTFHPDGSASKHLSGGVIDVQTITIPELATRHGPPDLIRMDVEGHEVEVMNGMIEAIQSRKMRPIIVFETHLSRYTSDHNMEKTLQRLFNSGYEIPLAATSWQRGTALLEAAGYHGGPPIPTDGVERVIVSNIQPKDAIEFLCRKGGLRTVVLSPTGSLGLCHPK